MTVAVSPFPENVSDAYRLGTSGPAAADALAAELAGIVGAGAVLTGFADRLVHARDRTPLAAFRMREGQLPASLPRLVVRPGSAAEVAAVLRVAARHDVAVVPYGAGSGVVAGAWPLGGEIVIDLKRLDRILSIDPIDATVTVEAGVNGGRFEAELNAAGFTTGHLPQSLHMSTVGGWVAARGAGQASSRYGKIEDMVLGLEVVLPDGSPLSVRPVARRAVGPSIKDVFVGSEGVFGVITAVTLRIWRKPEVEHAVVLAFPHRAAALTAARMMMQQELRPPVVRIYDETESAQRTTGLAAFADRPILAILTFAGPRRLADAEMALALEIAAAEGAVEGPLEPYHHWLGVRYVSYAPKWQSTGHAQDTIEITAPWSRVEETYARTLAAARAVDPDVYVAAHWSHVYAEGACQYTTMRFPPLPPDELRRRHAGVWDAISSAALACGGSVAHHHGSGALRNRWLAAELGPGGDRVMQALKQGLDPANLVNPGKLALPARPGAHEPWQGAQPAPTPPAGGG